ncbi:MAG TPA: PGF-pre-PGF domain-containing protein, partial [Patescibacteria group bacterium]|nr:PGF-pre-PGF domain-containing protein [Patescibacteria group bacterium]
NKSSGSGGYYNFTFNSMGNLADGFYNMTVYANDTGTNNLNNSQRIQFLIDNTLPTATFSCSPNSTTQSQTVTCTCSPSDALSGINSALTSGFISNPDTTIAGTYTPVCNFYDMAGNFNSTSTSYTITAASGTTTTTTTTTTNNQINTTNILTSIIPANISVINNFDPSFGVSEMRINVSSEADNVQITLVKYNGVPDAVSVAKNGSVFEYLQIQTQNLVSHLNSATLKIEVNKTWISANSLSTDDIALFKYNETSNNWYQLTTTFINEDDTYDYYNVELQNFSYFAIGQKQSTITQPPATQGTTTKDFTWLWIVLVGVVGAAILIVAFILIKKRTE